MRYFTLTMLASSLLCTQQAIYALQALPDHDLRQVDGQDGLHINTQYGALDIDELYWEDKTGNFNNTEKTLRAYAKGVHISKNNAYQNGNYNLGTEFNIGVGSNSNGNVGIKLDVISQPSTFTVDTFRICDGNYSEGSCDPFIDNKLALLTGSPIRIGLETTDGLFNKNSQAQLDLGLGNINIFMGFKNTLGEYDQLVLKNTNFNFKGRGVAYIDDVEGFVLHTNTGGNSTLRASKAQSPNSTYGYVDFSRVAFPDNEQSTGQSSATYFENGKETGSGLNLEFMTKNSPIDANNPVNLNNTKGVIRVGASGRIVNGMLQVRGTDASESTGGSSGNSVLGYVSAASGTTNLSPDNVYGVNKSVIGSTGIALRIKGEFTREGDAMLGADGKPTVLEIGGAGRNTAGFEFGELSPLISNSPERAYFDSGNVYLNLAQTQHLQLPENEVLNNSRFAGNGERLTTADDYIQQTHQASTNPRSVVIGVRGFEFQALSKQGRFTSSAGVSDPERIVSPTTGTGKNPDGSLAMTGNNKANEWGLGLPFHNMNANIALYSTKYAAGKKIYTLDNVTNQLKTITLGGDSDRLGLALALSVTGKDEKGTRTTSIMVIDANKTRNHDMYIGLRNIDMLLRGYGTVGLEQGQLNFDLPDLLMVMSAQVAGGFLPTYKSLTAPDINAASNINDTFDNDNDVLFGIKLKLLGDMIFSLIPQNEIGTYGSRMGIVGRYNIKPYNPNTGSGSTIQVSDPIDGSMLGFDKIQGVVEFNNAIVVNAKKDLNTSNVGFNYGFHFNPNQSAADVFRIRDLNLYPPENKINPALSPAGQRLGEMVFTGGRINANLGITPRN